MVRGCLVAAVVLVGCSFRHGVTGGDGVGGTIDAPPDTRPFPDAPACRSTCVDTMTLDDCTTNTNVTCPLGCHVDPTNGDRCAEPVPSNGATTQDLGPQDLVIDAPTTMNTTTGEIRVDASGIDLRSPGFGVSPEGFKFTAIANGVGVLGVNSLTITNTGVLKISGPLVPIILAAHDITIEGTLDVSGGIVACGSSPLVHCGGAGAGNGGAPGGDATGCSPGSGGSTTHSTGGGGGGYGAPAGGNGGAVAGTAGGAGGSGNCSTQQVVPLVGGSGGGGGGGVSGGAGGGGGGAIQLTALGNLEVHTTGAMPASVRANGAGGQAGAVNYGGGGGGSAGAILLEGQRVIIDGATLVANSGGGGAGDGGTDGASGTLTNNGASGGTGADPGGGGAARAASPGAGSGADNGTGGGGGGIGRIFINSGSGEYVLLDSPVVSPVEYHATAMSM